MLVLRELRVEHGPHSVELNPSPVRSNIPSVQAMSCHRDQGGCWGSEQPLSHALLARFTGLVSVLGGREAHALENDRTAVEIAERAIRPFVGPVEANFSAMCSSWGQIDVFFAFH